MAASRLRRAIGVGLVPVLALGVAACGPETPESRVLDTMRRVEGIRGLGADARPEYRFLPPERAFDDMLSELDDVEVVADLQAEAALYEHLGLFPADIDIVELARHATERSILGYYDPETKIMTVVDDDGEVGSDELMVLAHEHAHALQDAHFDLGSRLTSLVDDEQLALRALVEGEATIVMYVWAIKRLSPFEWDQIEAASAEDIATDYVPLESVPPILSRPGEFPYVDGASFVYEAWEPGGWAALADLWADPPVSTEQIMHPERYPHDRPVPVDLSGVAAALGPGWRVACEMTMGELQTSVLLADGRDWDYGSDEDVFVFPTWPGAEAAEGWGGDRIVELEGPRGEWVVVWQTSWDTRRDAAQFSTMAARAMADLDAPWVVRSGTDVSGTGIPNPVLVLVARDADALEAAARSLGTLPPTWHSVNGGAPVAR